MNDKPVEAEDNKVSAENPALREYELAVKTQMHFNEILMKFRSVGLAVVIAVYSYAITRKDLAFLLEVLYHQPNGSPLPVSSSQLFLHFLTLAIFSVYSLAPWLEAQNWKRKYLIGLPVRSRHMFLPSGHTLLL